VYRLVKLGISFEAIFGVILAAALVVLVFQARLFALAVQDRVIRLEERLRYEQVLSADLRARCGASWQSVKSCPLRFACDAELPALAPKSSGRKTDAAKGDQAAHQELEAGLPARIAPRLIRKYCE